MNIVRKPVSRSRREHRILIGLVSGVMIVAACGGGATDVAPENTTAQAPASTETTETTTTVAPTTTTLVPPDPCNPMPTSSTELVIETDLTEEQIKYFVCGLHIAVNEVESAPPLMRLALFNDKEKLYETMATFLPNSSFQGSLGDQLGHAGLFDRDVIYWDYARSVSWAENPAAAFRVGVHEMFHAIQSWQAWDGLGEANPAWIKEGAAEYFAHRMLEKYGFDKHLLVQVALGEDWAAGFTAIGMLAWWETYGPYPGTFPPINYPVLAAVAARLVDMSSEKALYEDYWQERSPDERWQDTFERVFGISVLKFYEAIDAEFG